MVKKVKNIKKIFALFITAIISLNAVGAACADSRLDDAVNKTAQYIISAVPDLSVGSIGGEWAVIGLKRSGYDINSEYFDKYYNNFLSHLFEKGGKLSERKYTEYSRAVLALTAIGKDPKNVSGYDILSPLYDYEKTARQGVNGVVFALLALDSGDYYVPDGLREKYIEEILSYRLSDGGFGFDASETASDIDMTAMALQALSKYKTQENVKNSIERALGFLSANQFEDGGFASANAETAESVSQVIIALCALGISVNDERFLKNGNTVTENLLSFMNDDGSFRHKLADQKPNQMATEQALCALSSLKRISDGKTSLYDMTDNRTDVGACMLMGLNAVIEIKEIYGVFKNEK